jgi:hypothetical protein
MLLATTINDIIDAQTGRILLTTFTLHVLIAPHSRGKSQFSKLTM